MPVSECYIFKNAIEYLPKDRINEVPRGVRGIYVLHHANEDETDMSVVYIGISQGKSGARSRLRKHRTKKADAWTHCSVYEVWDNISEALVKELEGLFRSIYKRDAQSNRLNIQKTYSPLKKIVRKNPIDLAGSQTEESE